MSCAASKCFAIVRGPRIAANGRVAASGARIEPSSGFGPSRTGSAGVWAPLATVNLSQTLVLSGLKG